MAGESGVGKTAAGERADQRARASGARVLSGDCVELGEGELPYAPLVGALRRVAREGDAAFDAIPESQRADLATILPGLGGGSREEGAEAEQVRVFEALLALLRRDGGRAAAAARHRGPALGRQLDARASSASWRARSAPSGCWWSAPTAPTSSTAATRCARCWPSWRATRSRTWSSSTGSRATRWPSSSRTSSASRADPGLVERLYSRSEGNPLFTEELLAVGLDGRGTLPPTLRDALMLRVERLSAPAQEVLRWLACQSLDDDLLGELAGIDSAELREGLREAIGSQIAVAHADGSYGFRHALLREVVYDDLLPGERAEQHGAIARALERTIERRASACT